MPWVLGALLVVLTAGATAQPSANWEIVVLGIAQDGGIPQLGCARPICQDIRAGKRPAEKVSSLGLINRGGGADELRHNSIVLRHLRGRWRVGGGAASGHHRG